MKKTVKRALAWAVLDKRGKVCCFCFKKSHAVADLRSHQMKYSRPPYRLVRLVEG